MSKAIRLFHKYGGILRTQEITDLGINSRTLYRMRDLGYIEALSKGVYHLIENNDELTYIDLAATSKRLPKGIICLVSALAFHGLTTQIPRAVDIAYQQGWRQPQVDYPPINVFRYSKASFMIGIEYHRINGVKVPIFSAAKTVVDCFKFRKRIGIDVAIEALKDYWHSHKQANINELFKYAKVCRVVNIITPYIEAITHE